jgi:hypothetical protein
MAKLLRRLCPLLWPLWQWEAGFFDFLMFRQLAVQHWDHGRVFKWQSYNFLVSGMTAAFVMMYNHAGLSLPTPGDKACKD